MKINQKRLVDSFITLVQISSESGEETEIITYLEKELSCLGFKTTVDEAGNLIAATGTKPIVALIAHTDTVKPGKNIKPIITESGEIKTDGSTILGADDKSGIASILEILKTIKDNGETIDLEVIFTVREETGLIGSSSLDFTKIKSKQAINLDSEPGDIEVGEPAIMQFDIEITGKAAHAGIHPENGINTIQIASEAINNLEWGRIDFETTSNVGLINGGLARNVVPEKTTLQAEVRSRSEEKFQKYCQKLEEEFKKAAQKYNGLAVINSIQRSNAYTVDRNDSLVQIVTDACNKNGIKPEIKFTGGITDANIFNAHGIRAITAGSCGTNIHSTEESIKIADLAVGTQIVLDAIMSLK